MRFEYVDERLVRGMRQISSAAGFRFEGNQKAVGESVGQSFWAVIGSIFERGNLWDFALKPTKRIDDLLHLFRRTGVLERQ